MRTSARSLSWLIPFSALIVLAWLLVPLARTEENWKKDDAFTSPRAQWYRDAKFGMFIHWGLYAVPAGYYHQKPVAGIGEWIMARGKIPISEYEQFAKQFNPTQFNADQWVATAKDAGMKYIVITSKHHDGFCMWGTKVVPYNIVDATPFHRDPMRELADACKRQGLKFCFYHSIMDWHHPELAGYWDADKDAAKDPNDPRVLKYINEQLKPQLKELVSNYDPGILWFDGEWVPWWSQEHGRDLEAYLHSLKPDLIINNRIGKRKMDDGDYETPEQQIPTSALGKRLWETCMTLNDTWGYKKDDHHWKSSNDVIRKLSDISGKGGNFLLNVGPTDKGIIPPESVAILHQVGQWLQPNGQAIYGSTYATLVPPAWGSVTRKGNTWYAIVFDWPKAGEPLVVPTTTPIQSAQLLNGSGEVKIGASDEKGTSIQLPSAKPMEPASIVVIDFKSEPQPVKAAVGTKVEVSIDGSFTLPASAAFLHGQRIKLEPTGNLGYWTNKSDYAEWSLDVRKAGTFDVEVICGVAPDDGGGFTITSGESEVAGNAQSTGGWNDYKPLKVGQIQLHSGVVTLTLKPSGEFHHALMNLQAIKLMPTGRS